MANFEEAIKGVLEIEGGYVNHPNDKGGPTNFGITQATLSAFRGKSVSVEDVKNLTIFEAKQIYKKNYWDAANLDKFDSQLIADVVFDQGVNRGVSTAVKNLQESYNATSRTKLAIDGKVGPKTLAAVNSTNELILAASFLKDAQLDYATIVANNPSQRVFIRGWINRTHLLLDKILSFVHMNPPSKEEEYELSLIEKIKKNSPNIPSEGLEKMIPFIQYSNKKEKIIFVDFNKKDTEKRLFVIDAFTGNSSSFLCSHGANSDPNKDGFPTKFSNEMGSNESSLGAMLTGALYGKAVGGWSKFKNALKLHGLEPGTNDNVFDRAIVMHEANYVRNGGDSLGCFALTPEDADALIPTLAGGYLLYAYHKS